MEEENNKLQKKEQIRNLKAGDMINDMFVVNSKIPVQEYRKGYRFELKIGDSSGEIALKFWGDNNKEFVEGVYNSIKKDDIIYVKGAISEFNNALEVSINDPEDMRVCKNEECDLSGFILTSKKHIEDMFNELESIIKTIRDPTLQKILDSFFSDKNFVKEFKTSPAAMYKHHGWIGGLLEHTLNVATLCRKMYDTHPEMDDELLLTGAILHDIGKIKEFELTSSIRRNKLGDLKGHIILGLELLTEKLKELNINEEDTIKLIHILLSHHGQMEWGSPIRPAFPEALAVFYADIMDAKVTQMISHKDDAVTEEDFIYTKDFGRIYLK